VSVFHRYEQPGSYQVRLTAINLISCNKTDIATKTINYFKDQIAVGDDGEICEGASYQLNASGGTNYSWSADNNSFTASNPNPVVQPENNTVYYVTVTDANNCIRKDTVEVRVVNRVDLQWEHQLIANCIDRPAILVQNMAPGNGDVSYRFEFGDGNSSSDDRIEHSYEQDGNYTVKFLAQKEFCEFEEEVNLPIYKILIPNVITPESSPGLNDYFSIGFGDSLIPPQDTGLTVHLVVFNRWGSKVFESPDYNNDWNAQGLAAGVYYIQLTVGDITTCKNWLQILK
jgi:PKD repeat protein